MTIQNSLQNITTLEKKFIQDIQMEAEIILTDINNTSVTSSSIKLTKLANLSDLKKLRIQTKSGFYIILTTLDFENNTCTLNCEYENCLYTAIYRGQADNIGSRIIGHLFTDQYTGTHTNFINVKHLNTEYNGINIDKGIFNKYKWLIIAIVLDNSKKNTRELFEQSFDNLFKKPIFSKV